jgi:hypothetical protein
MNSPGVIVASRFGTVYISTRHNKERSSVRTAQRAPVLIFQTTVRRSTMSEEQLSTVRTWRAWKTQGVQWVTAGNDWASGYPDRAIELVMHAYCSSSCCSRPDRCCPSWLSSIDFDLGADAVDGRNRRELKYRPHHWQTRVDRPGNWRLYRVTGYPEMTELLPVCRQGLPLVRRTLRVG